MITALRTTHLLATLVSLAIVFGSLVYWAPGVVRMGGFSVLVNVFVLAVGVAVLIGVAYFSTLRFASCSVKVSLAVYLLWIAVFTWLGWFGLSAPLRLHEIHFFDPVQAAAERARFFLGAAVAYGLLVAFFSIWPILKVALTRHPRPVPAQPESRKQKRVVVGTTLTSIGLYLAAPTVASFIRHAFGRAGFEALAG